MSFSRNTTSYFPRPRLRSQTTLSMTVPTQRCCTSSVGLERVSRRSRSGSICFRCHSVPLSFDLFPNAHLVRIAQPGGLGTSGSSSLLVPCSSTSLSIRAALRPRTLAGADAGSRHIPSHANLCEDVMTPQALVQRGSERAASALVFLPSSVTGSWRNGLAHSGGVRICRA
jgi:hypothetical protein